MDNIRTDLAFASTGSLAKSPMKSWHEQEITFHGKFGYGNDSSAAISGEH